MNPALHRCFFVPPERSLPEHIEHNVLFYDLVCKSRNNEAPAKRFKLFLDGS